MSTLCTYFVQSVKDYSLPIIPLSQMFGKQIFESLRISLLPRSATTVGYQPAHSWIYWNRARYPQTSYSNLKKSMDLTINVHFTSVWELLYNAGGPCSRRTGETTGLIDEQPWATCSRRSCLCTDMGLERLQGSLPASPILWACGSVWLQHWNTCFENTFMRWFVAVGFFSSECPYPHNMVPIC